MPWCDVDSFFIYRLPKGGKMIGFNFKPGPPGIPSLVKIARLLGAEAAFPTGWKLQNEKVVELLNTYRLHAAEKTAAPRSPVDAQPPGRRPSIDAPA